MAKAGAVYPQVEPGAIALAERSVVTCAPGVTVGRALALGERAGAEVVVAGRSAVRAHELARAAAWGLSSAPVRDLAWSGLPAVGSQAGEIVARRLLLAGARMILVRDARRLVGVIDAERVEQALPTSSVTHLLERLVDRGGGASVSLLRTAGKVGEAMKTPVFAVGGFVRDLLLDRMPPDLDLVVEGDGIAFARRLAEEIGGRLVVHPGFGTASLEATPARSGSGGPPRAGVDVASARRERYEAPGALPVVSPASLREDLRRRDFSVNAMAMALQPGSFGRLLDPLGGRRDLDQHRLRPLHPLSFVEDPTRIFRAARYAARLGLRLDPSGLRALRLARRLGAFPALSGERLRAELDLLVREPRATAGFERLLSWKALTIWDASYRFSMKTRVRLRETQRLGRWLYRSGVSFEPAELALLALLLDQPPSVSSRCLERLTITGQARSRLRAALAADGLATALEPRGLRPSQVSDRLAPAPVTVLVGAFLAGRARARRRIEWFLGPGRAPRPLLSGDQIVAVGVPRGPAVGRCLAALRRLRQDGVLSTLAEERDFVKEWLQSGKEA